jgi:hypothetical protein
MVTIVNPRLLSAHPKSVTGQTLSGMTCNRDAKAVRADEVRVGVWR